MLIFFPDCRAVLRGLRKIARTKNDMLTFVSDQPYICLSQDYSQYYDYTRYAGQIGAILDELAEEGYLRPFDSFRFALTHRGLHPTRHMFKMICTSVVIPIIVSFFTTVITLLVNGLLELPL